MLYELVEYFIHRCLHSPVECVVTARHTQHHRKHIRSRYQYPLLRTLWGAGHIIATAVAVGLCFATCHPLTVYGAASVLSYNACHWRAHVNPESDLGKYHRAHHQDARYNFGIGSPLGDVLGGTLSSKFQVTRPWLLLLPPPLAFKALSERHERTTAAQTKITNRSCLQLGNIVKDNIKKTS